MSNPCKFVRRNCVGYEYGDTVVKDQATKHEKREHVVLGRADTYEEALAANAMATQGMPRGKTHIKPTFYN